MLETDVVVVLSESKITQASLLRLMLVALARDRVLVPVGG